MRCASRPPSRARASQRSVGSARRASLPVENLLEPALLRRLAWEPPAGDLGEALAEGGARPWQIGLVEPIIAAAFVDPA